MRRKSIKAIEHLEDNSEEEPICRVLPGDELCDQFLSHHALQRRVNLLDRLRSTRGNPSRQLLHQHAGSCSRPQADRGLPEAEAASAVRKAGIPLGQSFYLLPGVAGVSIHHCASFLRTAFSTKILVILWDLLFLEGTSVLLKAVIVLIDQIETIIMSCKETCTFASLSRIHMPD